MNDCEISYPVEKQPRDVLANLETLVNTALAAHPHTALLGDDDVARLRELQTDFDKTMPQLLCDPFAQAKTAFAEQQRAIASGKKVTDAFSVEEHRADIFLRINASRDHLIEVTREARSLYEKAIPKIAASLKACAAEIEAKERETHAQFGIDEYRPSFLSLALKDAPRRVTHQQPRGDSPCSSPRKFVFGIQL